MGSANFSGESDWTPESFSKRFEQPLNRAKGRRDQLRERLMRTRADAQISRDRHENAVKARALVQGVAETTQKKMEHHVGNVVSLAEAAVFPNPYQFEIEFVQRRNKTECDVWFVRGEDKMEPVASSGGGTLDVASFALRCLFLSLRDVRPVVVLDEPFRFVSVDLQEKCGAMIKAISERLGLQVLMVSHLPRIYSGADKVFRVTQSGGVSKVEEL